MECIELLFAAWFEDQGSDSLAQNAMEIYHFVRRSERNMEKPPAVLMFAAAGGLIGLATCLFLLPYLGMHLIFTCYS